MTKTDNIFARIAEGILLCIIAYFYTVTGNIMLLALVSNVIIGTVAYRKHVFAVILESVLVLGALVFASMQNMYVDLFSVLIDFLNLLAIGITAGYVLKYNKSFFTAVSAVSFAQLFVTILALLYVKRGGSDIFEMYVGAPIDMYSDAFMRAFSQSGVYSKENAEVFSNILDMVYTVIKMFMPSIIIISSVITAFFTFTVTKKTIEFSVKQKLSVMPFSHIRLGKKTSLALTVLILLLFIMQRSMFSDALSNILVLMLFAHFVCGVSVIDFYFAKTRLNWLIRLIIYAVVLMFACMSAPFLLPGLVIVGMLDSRYDIRKIGQDIKPENEEDDGK